MSRGISLGFAVSLSLVGLVFPFLLGASANGLNQSVLMMMMLGIAGAFIHGAGFRPAQPWLRWLISPTVCWPVMLISAAALLAMR